MKRRHEAEGAGGGGDAGFGKVRRPLIGGFVFNMRTSLRCLFALRVNMKPAASFSAFGFLLLPVSGYLQQFYPPLIFPVTPCLRANAVTVSSLPCRV